MDLPSLLCDANRMASLSPRWRAQLVAGPPPSAFSISGRASWCRDLWKKERKESRVSTGVILGS